MDRTSNKWRMKKLKAKIRHKNRKINKYFPKLTLLLSNILRESENAYQTASIQLMQPTKYGDFTDTCSNMIMLTNG
jgi:hypothetical protein